VLDVQFLLKAPARLKQPVSPILGDRPAFALAFRFQRAATLTHPRTPALRAGDEPTRIELNRRRRLIFS
jgi:hypothetical protein